MPRAHFIFLSRGTNPRTLPSLQVLGTMRGSEAVSKSDEPTPPRRVGHHELCFVAHEEVCHHPKPSFPVDD